MLCTIQEEFLITLFHNFLEVLRKDVVVSDINGRGDSLFNVGFYTIQDSDKDGFSLRCYNKKFDPSTPGAEVSMNILPNCEYCTEKRILKG